MRKAYLAVTNKQGKLIAVKDSKTGKFVSFRVQPALSCEINEN